MRTIIGSVILVLLAMAVIPGHPPILVAHASHALSPEPPSDAVFHVSPQGNDHWTGHLATPNAKGTDGPFMTLTRARDAVRQAKGGRIGATVYVHGGTYEISEPIIFRPEDSGAPGAPVIYVATSDSDAPVLSGGRTVTGWRDGQNGLWMAQVPGIKEGHWSPHQFFVNGQRRHRASSPASGFANMEGEVSTAEHAQFQMRGADISPDDVQDGVDALTLDRWSDFRGTVLSVDGQTVTLSHHRPSGILHPDLRYRFENVRSGLSAEGSWFVSRREGAIYYHPMPGESPDHVATVASYLPSVILLEGSGTDSIRDITFRGLTISYTDWTMPDEKILGHQADADLGSAVQIQGGHSITFDHCTFSHIGLFALDFNHGSKSNQIVNNEMVDLGAGGLKIGDPNSDVHPKREGGGGGGNRRPNSSGLGRRPRFGQQQGGGPGGPQTVSTNPADYRFGPDYPRNDAETCSDNTISGNRIHDLGLVFAGAGGIWIGQSYANTISHNDLFNTYHAAINVGWSWGFVGSAAHNNIIEFNNLYNIGRSLMSDVGAIYILGVQPGTVIRNNVIHDVTRYDGPAGYGGWGIYLDAGTSQVRVENNLVYRTEDGAIHQGAGENNSYTNNIFAYGEKAQIRRISGAPELSFTFERNIVYWSDDSPLFLTALEQGSYQFDNNLYYCTCGNIEMAAPHGAQLSFRNWQEKGQDVHTIVANPMFVDPEHGNFALRPGSPAFKIGFKPFDYSLAGAGGK